MASPSGEVRRPGVSLARLEPAVPFFLGLHGLATTALTSAPLEVTLAFAFITCLGIAGLAGWVGTGAVRLRAVACLAVALALQLDEPDARPVDAAVVLLRRRGLQPAPDGVVRRGDRPADRRLLLRPGPARVRRGPARGRRAAVGCPGRAGPGHVPRRRGVPPATGPGGRGQGTRGGRGPRADVHGDARHLDRPAQPGALPVHAPGGDRGAGGVRRRGPDARRRPVQERQRRPRPRQRRRPARRGRPPPGGLATRPDGRGTGARRRPPRRRRVRRAARRARRRVRGGRAAAAPGRRRRRSPSTAGS